MKAIYRGSTFTIDYECSDLKTSFAFLASCGDLFGAAECCNNCQGTDLRPKYTKTKGGYEYYSLICKACHWEFKFGQRKDDGGLYPKGWEPPYERSGGDQEHSQEEPVSKESLKRNAPF